MTDGNESAMPFVLPRGEDDFSTGMTKREYFAAEAMKGMASSQFWSENFTDNGEDLEQVMRVAVLAADALIKELNKTEK